MSNDSMTLHKELDRHLTVIHVNFHVSTTRHRREKKKNKGLERHCQMKKIIFGATSNSHMRNEIDHRSIELRIEKI